MQWYYSENGSQAGPISEEELRGKIAAGSVKPEDLVWHDGMSDWQPLAKTPELASSLAPQVSSPSGPPNVPAAGSGGSPYQSPVTASPANQLQMGPEIPTYLWQSIVVTILCCWPLGIPAIVYAAKVDGLKRSGDWQAAQEASNAAKMWCWISFGLGLIANLAAFGFIFYAESSSSF